MAVSFPSFSDMVCYEYTSEDISAKRPVHLVPRRRQVRRSMISVRRVDDARSAFDAAADFLRSRPLENNFVATWLDACIHRNQAGRCWLIYDAGRCCGAAVQTPLERRLCLTWMDEQAAAALADHLAAEDVQVPVVSGPAPASALFAAIWARHRRLAAFPTGQSQAYEQRSPCSLPYAAGALAQASQADLVVAIQLMTEFFADTGEDPGDLAALVRHRIAEGVVYLWIAEGEVEALASHSRPVNGVSRIQAVFTRKQGRGRGFGLSAAAALSELLARQGLLRLAFADASNQVSQRLCRRAGYRQAFELVRFGFSATPEEPGAA